MILLAILVSCAYFDQRAQWQEASTVMVYDAVDGSNILSINDPYPVSVATAALDLVRLPDFDVAAPEQYADISLVGPFF